MTKNKKNVVVMTALLILAASIFFLYEFFKRQENQIRIVWSRFPTIPNQKNPNKKHKFYWFSLRKYDFDEIRVQVSPGVELHGVLFYAYKDRNKRKGLVFTIKPPWATVDKCGKMAQFPLDEGYDTFLFDFRSDGLSSDYKTIGSLSEQMVYTDADKVFKYVSALYKNDKIVIHSMCGSSPIAVYVSTQNDNTYLILENPILSWRKTMESYYISGSFIDNYRQAEFDTEALMMNSKSHVIILYSGNDRWISPSFAKRLYEVATQRSNKSLTSKIENVGNLGHAMQRKQEYHEAFARTLNEIASS
jgi:hypothetical protein